MIKNIIFDLGGVILDVDYNRASNAFIQSGIKDFNSLYSKQKQAHLFDRFEKGIIHADEFRSVIKELNPALTDKMIDDAWNSMIINTPPERMTFLKNLSTRYHLYLLSNTNEIHIKFFRKYYHDHYGENYFELLFKKIYLSSEWGLRKPEKEIFDLVMNQNNLKSSETIFIDDSPQHVAGAIDAGIQALLLPPGEKIETFLEKKLKAES